MTLLFYKDPLKRWEDFFCPEIKDNVAKNDCFQIGFIRIFRSKLVCVFANRVM